MGSCLLVACGAPAAREQARTASFMPHAEDVSAGPFGTGNARCGVFVYAWTGAGPCRVQVNHCSVAGGGSDEIVCLSLADPRTLECGTTTDVCGEAVRCDCPEGEAPPYPEVPGTWHVQPTELGASIQSDDALCAATVTSMEGGPPPTPCIFAMHECDASGACVDRTQMVSCDVRSTLCGRPIRCDCPVPPHG